MRKIFGEHGPNFVAKTSGISIAWIIVAFFILDFQNISDRSDYSIEGKNLKTAVNNESRFGINVQFAVCEALIPNIDIPDKYKGKLIHEEKIFEITLSSFQLYIPKEMAARWSIIGLPAKKGLLGVENAKISINGRPIPSRDFEYLRETCRGLKNGEFHKHHILPPVILRGIDTRVVR